jgi:hypothetical protein
MLRNARAHHRVHNNLPLVQMSTSRALPPNFFKLRFSIISGFPSFRFPYHNSVCISSIPHSAACPCLSRPQFGFPRKVWQGMQIMKFVIRFYPVSSYFNPRPLLVRPDISLGTTSWRTISRCSSFSVRDQVSPLYTELCNITVWARCRVSEYPGSCWCVYLPV